MDIQKKIKLLLAANGITQGELAKRLNISQAAVSSRISRNITVSSLIEILDALNTTPEEFFQEQRSNKTTAATICPHCGKPIKITLI